MGGGARDNHWSQFLRQSRKRWAPMARTPPTLSNPDGYSSGFFYAPVQRLVRDYSPIGKPVRRKLDKNRTADLAIPKVGVRVRDESVLDRARQRGYCEVCGARGPVEAAHVISRGAGGHDTDSNVATLCHTCHMKHHTGQIKTADIQRVVDERERRKASRYRTGGEVCSVCGPGVAAVFVSGHYQCSSCGIVLVSCCGG